MAARRLPYLAGRLDRCHEMIPACSSVIKEKPSEYLKRIWYDTVVYDQRALEMCIAVAGSPDRVLYGSDYPHNIGDMEGLPRARRCAAGARRQSACVAPRRGSCSSCDAPSLSFSRAAGEGAERAQRVRRMRGFRIARAPTRSLARHPPPLRGARTCGRHSR